LTWEIINLSDIKTWRKKNSIIFAEKDSMEIFSVETGNFKLDGGALFGVVPKVIWQKMYQADENNLVNLAARCMVVKDGEKNILIDTGIGEKQDHNFLKYYYLNGDATLLSSLARAGLHPKDITDVILTHLHFDHCGGAIKKEEGRGLIPVFPNALYHVSQEQWEWALDPNSREKASYLQENILPLKENHVLNFVKPGLFSQNVELRFFHGHTKGLVIPFVRYKNETLVFAGDLVPLAGNIPVNYICAYDIQPLVAMDEKEDFLKEAVEKKYTLFLQHDLERECCTLKMTGKGPRVDKIFSLGLETK